LTNNLLDEDEDESFHRFTVFPNLIANLNTELYAVKQFINKVAIINNKNNIVYCLNNFIKNLIFGIIIEKFYKYQLFLLFLKININILLLDI
jgi:hypothetical protein